MCTDRRFEVHGQDLDLDSFSEKKADLDLYSNYGTDPQH